MIKSTTTGLLFLSSCFLLLLTGCDLLGSPSSSNSPSINAPTSVIGKSYRMTISSGFGSFPTEGSYEKVSFNTSRTYTIEGDLRHVPNSNGTYTYSVSGNTATLELRDRIFLNTLGVVDLTLVFTSNSGGTFEATGNTAPVSRQSGTFVEI